jgi:hypothetical protein
MKALFANPGIYIKTARAFIPSIKGTRALAIYFIKMIELFF